MRWKIQPFFQFSPWRDPRLKHLSGYPFGTSRKKTSTIFYNTAILLVTHLEFRESASHFLMARPSKTSGKRMIPLRAITQRLCYCMWLFHLHSAVENTAFFPVFPLAESTAKAFFRLSLWNFKEKNINYFL